MWLGWSKSFSFVCSFLQPCLHLGTERAAAAEALGGGAEMWPLSSNHPFKPAVFRHGMLHKDSQATVVDVAWDKEDNGEDDSARRSYLPLAQAAMVVAAEETEGGRTTMQPSSSVTLPPVPLPVQRCSDWRLYPTIPYYATIQGLQLIINIGGSGKEAEGDLNSAMLLKNLPALQAILQDVTAKHGNVYYLSALPATRNTLLSSVAVRATHAGTSLLPPPPAPELDNWRYLQALHDAFRRFAELRDECNRSSSLEPCTHHVLFVRIEDHPRLKDLVALLAIERGRLCFCLAASSRVTQQYFTQRAQDVGVDLEWVQGSVLLSEPSTLLMTDVNPVFALWDVFVNLQLYVTPYDARDTSAWVYDGSSGGYANSQRILRHVNVTVISSLRFAGCECHLPALRLCEVGKLLTGGRRLLWSLVGESHVVLPHFVAELVGALVGYKSVDCFELRFVHDNEVFSSGMNEASDAASRGVTCVTGARRSVVKRSGSSSCASPRVFSRLSAESWLTDEDRRHFGLFLDGDPVPLECEFIADSLQYCRRMGERLQPTMDNEKLEQQLPFVQRWGPCFRLGNHVERIIHDEEE